MEILKEKDESLIPPGSYCSVFLKRAADKDGVPFWWMLKCPYHELKSDKPDQSCGYCHFLEAGDWEENGTFLLWDSIKECVSNQSKEEDWMLEFGGNPFLYYTSHISWGEKMLNLIEEGEYKEIVKEWLNKLKTEQKDRETAMENCKCETLCLSTSDYKILRYDNVKPSELMWRCDTCNKEVRKLTDHEVIVAENMFKSGFYFGHKEIVDKIREAIK